MTRVLFLVGCDHPGYKLDSRLSLRFTLLDHFSSFLKYKWTYLCIRLLRISVISISIVERKFSYCPRNFKRRTQFKLSRFLPPVKKAVTISRHSKVRKKNFISENYNVQSTFVPNLVNVFCHHHKRPISGLGWVHCMHDCKCLKYL